MRLRQAELRPLPVELRDALGEVLTDGEPCDVLPCGVPWDAVTAGPDDDDELDLPVHVPLGELDRGLGPGQAGGELRERHRQAVGRVARLVGVLAVVDADREDLPRPGHRRAEVGAREPHALRIDLGRPCPEPRPVGERRHGVGTEASSRRLGHIDREGFCRVAGDQHEPPGEVGDPHQSTRCGAGSP
ncbi:hypothetical protein Microterr_24510 [Microbacterium terricola]|uniref:Uncharacterized protein n=1 Tax=Microbacterium terricola TaxID=344163 RepID=A0ABM8E238_9MICO|nr:hypothetical protein Microterr_24510 [Microbacterium terricola]